MKLIINIIDNKKYLHVISIIIIGAILRIYNLGNYSITADELSALQRTDYNSFTEMITQGVLIDFHPPLVQTFMYYWCKIFGITEFAVRIPFAILSILSIFIYYQIATKWFNKNTAILSSAAIACNQLMLIYSRLARPYAFGIFFTAAAILYLTKIILNDKQKFKDPILFVFFSWCAINTHYFCAIYVFVLGMCSLLFMNKMNYKTILISGICIITSYIPTYPILKYQLNAGGIGAESGGWLWLPDFNFLIDYIKYIFNGSRYIMFFYLILAIFLTSKYLYKSKYDEKGVVEKTNFKFRVIALTIFLLPIIFGYLYSYMKNPILQHSVLCFSTPFIFIFLFSFINENYQIKKTSLILTSLLIIVNYFTIYAHQFYQTNFFGVYKPIAEKTVEWESKYGKQNLTHLINIDNAYFINYYYKQWNKQINYEGYNFVGRESLKNIVEIVEKSETEFFSFAWSNISSPAEITEIIKSKYPFLVESKFFFNSEYYLFSKHATNNHVNEVVFQNYMNLNGDNGLFHNNEQCYNLSEGIKNSRCIELNENVEFSPGIEIIAKDMYKAEQNILNISLLAKAFNTDSKAEIVVQFKNKDTITSWQGMSTNIFTKDTINWHRVYFSLPLPANSSINDIMNIYFWNTSKKKILFDEIKITSTLGNPIKYSINKEF